MIVISALSAKNKLGELAVKKVIAATVLAAFSSNASAALFTLAPNTESLVAALNNVNPSKVSSQVVSGQDLITLSDCCTGFPDPDTHVSHSLSYELSNTKVTLTSPEYFNETGFIWSDLGGPTPLWETALSIGDVDNDEHDLFRFYFEQENVFGFSFEVLENTQTIDENIIITLYDGSSFGIATSRVFSSSEGIDTYSFVATNSGIRSVTFFESDDDDDIALTGFKVTSHVVPLPAAVWLFGSALAGLGLDQTEAKSLSRNALVYPITSAIKPLLSVAGRS